MDVIHELSDCDEFYHVASAFNVADDYTRGLHPSALGLGSRWQDGESLLKLPVEELPITPLKAINTTITESPQ